VFGVVEAVAVVVKAGGGDDLLRGEALGVRRRHAAARADTPAVGVVLVGGGECLVRRHQGGDVPAAIVRVVLARAVRPRPLRPQMPRILRLVLVQDHVCAAPQAGVGQSAERVIDIGDPPRDRQADFPDQRRGRDGRPHPRLVRVGEDFCEILFAPSPQNPFSL
jgi:hypothetical protein